MIIQIFKYPNYRSQNVYLISMEALITVTDEKYIAGTQVLFHSFLNHHPNFKGDFVVIHNQLPQRLQAELTKQFSVKFKQVSKELQLKLTDLAVSCPQYNNKLQRFWSLELFRLKQYKNVLFLDSDIICRGNLEELFRLEDDYTFAACADLSFYRGQFRDKISFELKSLAQMELANSFEKTFNAGVLLVNLKENRKQIYNDLLNLIDPKIFKSVSSGHTDQYLLNTYFEHKVTWMDASYNYIIREAEFIAEKVGISKEEAKLWHYIRNPKPWNFNRLLKNKLKGKENPSHILEWQREYQDFLRLKKGVESRLGDQIRMLVFKLIS